jgi:hypothetical protein
MNYKEFLELWFEDKNTALDLLRTYDAGDVLTCIGAYNNIVFPGHENYHRLIEGSGDNLFYHLARTGDFSSCESVISITTSKGANISDILSERDITGTSPLILAIVNSNFHIAKLFLTYIPKLESYGKEFSGTRFFYVASTRNFFGNVKYLHPLQYALAMRDTTQNNNILTEVIVDIISKVNFPYFRLIFRDIVKTKHNDIFKSTFSRFGEICLYENYRVLCEILQSSCCQLLQSYFEVLRTRFGGNLVDLSLSSDEFNMLTSHMLQNPNLLSIFLQNYDTPKVLRSKTDIAQFLGRTIIENQVFARDDVRLIPILKMFVSHGLLGYHKHQYGIDICSNHLILSLLSSVSNIPKRTPNIYNDRTDSIVFLLNIGMRQECEYRHYHNTYGIGTPRRAYPEGDAVKFAKSLPELHQFIEPLCNHHRYVTLFDILYDRI